MDVPETITVKSEEARTRFRELLDRAERGGEVRVFRYQRPVAVLVSDEWHKRAKAALEQVQREEQGQ